MKKVVLIFVVFFAFAIFAQLVASAERQNDLVDLIIESDYDHNYMLGSFHKIRLQKKDLKYLGKRSWIEKEYKLLLDTAVPLVGVSDFWNSSYNGSGVKICILDTGINKTHHAFGSRVIAEKDFVIDDSDGNSTEDFHGHGTHVAGIAASEDSTYRGIAYGALLLNAKVFSSTTVTATDSNIMNGIDWCIEQGADILSMSFGGAGTSDDLLSVYVDLAADQGKIVVIAAGNSGSGDLNCGLNGTSSICSPGLAHKVITVGSTKKDDSISSFSSQGPTEDGRIKPDVTAPGQSIISANRNGGWTTLSGTSMSTPMVSGLAAVVKQARPDIIPEELKALIMNTAMDLGNEGKDNIYGAGRISGTNVLDEINNTRKENASEAVYFVDLIKPNIKATLYWPENYDTHTDFDFYLVDPYGNFVRNSTSVNNTDEQVNFNNTNRSFGRWKLFVKSKNSSTPYAIASNNPISAKLFGKSSVINEKSPYHKINVTNDTFSVFLDFDYMTKNLDLHLYDPNRNTFISSLKNSTENITFSNATKGLWTARITGDETNYFLTSNNFIFDSITDTTPPEITITSPFNKTYNNETINITIFVTEDFNQSVSCEGELNESVVFEQSIVSGSVFSGIITANQGLNTFFVSCTDDDNNTASKNVNFTIDSVVRLQLNNPTPNNEVFYFSNTVTINASSENLDTMILEWNGINETVPGNISTRIIVKNDLEDGNYTFRLFVNDTNGNTNVSETIWVFINATRNRKEIFDTINFDFELLNSTNSKANASRLLSFEKYSLKFNLTNISVSVYDFFADSLNGTVNITQDISLPFENIIADVFWLDFDMIEKGKYSAYVSFANTHKIFFYLNGTKNNFTYTRITNICNSNVSNTPCLNSSRTDASGVQAHTLFLPSFSGAAAVTDLTSPELKLNSPSSTTYDSVSVSLSFEVGDNVGIDTCWYNLNGINNTLSDCSNTTMNASIGSNSFTLFANDSSGNTNQSSVVFTVSLPAPSPAPTQTAASSSSDSSGGISSPVVAAQPAPQRQNTTNVTQPKIEPVVEKAETLLEEEEANNETQIVPETQNVPVTGLATNSEADYTLGLAVFAIIALGLIGFYIYRRFR